jgi:hypothetical protein
MEDFEVDGTTLLSWTMRVRAHNERDALDEAQRIATWVEIPSSLATVHGGQYEIAHCRVTDPENE